MTDTSEYTLDLLAAEQAKFQALAKLHQKDPFLSKLWTARLNWVEYALKVKSGGGTPDRDTNLYHCCWDVLVAYAGAYEGKEDRERDRFVNSACDRSQFGRLTEYRFGGRLGFGGKFWRTNGRLFVACYREDENPERRAIVEITNGHLANLTPACGVWGPP